MEKRVPHFVLAEIQAIVADACNRVFTRLALAGGLSLGLTEPEMREVVLSLSRADFLQINDNP